MGGVGSVLVAGDGVAGWVVAIAMAQGGFDVSLVQAHPGMPIVDSTAEDGLHSLSALGVAVPRHDPRVDGAAVRAAVERTMASLGIESRSGVALLGSLEVDNHVEAELSNGRVENYDAIVIADERVAHSLGVGPRHGGNRLAVVRDIEQAQRLAARLVAGGAVHPS